MITYDPRNWLAMLFSFRGTVVPAILPRVVLFTSLAAGLAAFDQFVAPIRKIDHLGHTLTGVVVGFLLVLRTNTAYDRFWEGRKLWGGIVNATRNLVRQAAVYAGQAGELANLVSAYVIGVKQHLRHDRDLSEAKPWVSAELFAQLEKQENPPLLLSSHLSAWIERRRMEGKIDSITAMQIEDRVRELIDLQGACERILKTPIPFNYAVHIKQFLMIYLVTLPFVFVSLWDWLAVPVVAVISFGLSGIEEAGVEVEDPFGDDPNDLPLEALCFTIVRDSGTLAEYGGKPDHESG
jgi:putative membrane protein